MHPAAILPLLFHWALQQDKIYRKQLIRALLRVRKNLITRPDLRRNALLSFDDSPWRKLQLANDDLAYRKATGLSIRAFDILFEVFSSHPLFESRYRNKGLSPHAVLGLILVYMRNPCYEHNIQMIFGATRSATNRYINFGLVLLYNILKSHPMSKVFWPSAIKMEEYSQLIIKKKSALRNQKIFGFVDGFRLRIKSFSDPAEQNAYYQFHEKGTVVGNIVVYAPDGCCIWYCINMPGSWHDSKIAWDLYDTLLDTNQTAAQYKLVADSGFRIQIKRR